MSDVTTELAMEASDKAVEIARIRAENARLRESVKRLMTQRDERLARAEADNAKLRELANRMLGSIRRFEACSDSYSVSSVYEQWMRELGVVE